MKILITGGAGYIGCSLAEKLSNIESVNEIIIYDNLSANKYNIFSNKKLQNGKIKFVIADIFDNRSLKKAVQQVDVIYHLAAKVSEPDRATDGQFFEQVNHWGTAQLVSEIEQCKTVKKVIYTSSIYVYGHQPNILNEQSATSPNSFYGVTKLKGEQQLYRIKDNVDTFIFRVASVFGFNKCVRYNVILNKFLFDAHFFNKITIIGDGNQTRPFIHLENLVEALVTPISTEISPGIYNVADTVFSINEIVEAVIGLYPNIEYQYLNKHLDMASINLQLPDKTHQYCTRKDIKLSKRMTEIKRNLI